MNIHILYFVFVTCLNSLINHVYLQTNMEISQVMTRHIYSNVSYKIINVKNIKEWLVSSWCHKMTSIINNVCIVPFNKFHEDIQIFIHKEIILRSCPYQIEQNTTKNTTNIPH